MMSHDLFIEHYNKHKDKLYSFFFYRLSGNSLLAEDLTSDTFCKAYEKRNSYNDEYAFSTWVYTIARNTLIDYFRKKNEPLQLDEDLAETIISDEKELTIKSEIDFRIFSAKFYKALEKCSDFQKDVLVLKYLEDLNAKTIAQILGTTPENVRQASSRGIKIIRPILKIFMTSLILSLLLL